MQDTHFSHLDSIIVNVLPQSLMPSTILMYHLFPIILHLN